MSGARCEGQSFLFTSTDAVDHGEAKSICEGRDGSGRCPMFESCEATVRDILAGPHQSGLHGTWAGKLYGGRAESKRPGAKRKPREHGTDRGYHQHRTHGDATCADCMAAHRAAVWFRTACEHPLVDISNALDNRSKETTNASRPRINGAGTPTRGLADRLETTDSCTS